ANSTTGGEIWRSNDGTAWVQANTDGFGDSANTDISALKVFDGQIYAATTKVSGGDILRSNDGTTWTAVLLNGFGDPGNYVIEDLEVFNSKIYASTWNSTNGSEIWSSTNGSVWDSVDLNGFGNPDNIRIQDLQVFNGYLYACTSNNISGGEVWRSDDGNSWAQVASGGFGDNTNTNLQSLCPFGDYIYASTGQSAGGEMWRFYRAYLDPLITGNVYDAKTGELIDSPIVSIYQEGKDEAIKTSNTNPYRVNVDDGIFYFRVEKEGYIFPSNTVAAKTNGDHGELFAATGDEMSIDFYMDPGYPLELKKTASKKNAVIGDIITFNISIKNLSSTKWTNSVVIHDMLTNGFKFVDNSTYIDETKSFEPVIQDRDLQFQVNDIPGYTTINLSYQVRVGVGMVPGKYTTKAYAWNSIRDWRLSNDTSCKIIIQSDPIFERGTVIGKVFEDLNGNGKQDKDEDGVEGIGIFMENGCYAITDKNGKYHIASILPGTHSLKVKGNYNFSTENPKVIDVTEGLPVKVNFGLLNRNEYASSEDKFFIVALGEGISRNFTKKGNIEMIEKNDKYDIMSNVDGKFALYLKGKVKGKYLVTASIDTDRRKDKFGESEYKTKLLKNLDPDKYYPVYGDASESGYDADNTQDMLYLMVEWNDSYIRWGTFNTDIPLYNRTFHGGSVKYSSVGKTDFGIPKTEVNAFAAQIF
ncbi:MAG: NHL repeat-containing protein, partial [uncultured bacterium]